MRGSEWLHLRMLSIAYSVRTDPLSPWLPSDCLGYACKRADGGKRDMHSSMSAWASPCKSVRDDVSSVAQLFDMQTAFLCKCVWTASDTVQYSGTKAQVYGGKGDRNTECKSLKHKTRGFGTCDISLPPVPFVTQMLGSSPGTAQNVLDRHNKATVFFCFKWWANMLKMSPSKESLQTAFSAPFFSCCCVYVSHTPPSPSFRGGSWSVSLL